MVKSWVTCLARKPMPVSTHATGILFTELFGPQGQGPLTTAYDTTDPAMRVRLDWGFPKRFIPERPLRAREQASVMLSAFRSTLERQAWQQLREEGRVAAKLVPANLGDLVR
jgi:hypothetical protein